MILCIENMLNIFFKKFVNANKKSLNFLTNNIDSNRNNDTLEIRKQKFLNLIKSRFLLKNNDLN